MDKTGYEKLAVVLQAAYAQAATGKGAERHADDKPFHEQPMQQIASRRGIGFILGQADKKSEEAQGMLSRGQIDAFEREILGAIVYLAGAIVFARRGESVVAEPVSPFGEPDAEGWYARDEINWEIPRRLPQVDVVFRSGAYHYDNVPGDLSWSLGGGQGDIVMWRPSPPRKTITDSAFGKPDAEGWYEWNGSEVQRPAGKVEVLSRQGIKTTEPAELLHWEHRQNPGDIVKWRPAT